MLEEAMVLRDVVAEQIRRWIIVGELPPGQRLIERQLCERLEVSRATLRECYRQLEAEGLLLLTPHKSPTVTQMSYEEARAVYEVREALECYAVKLFVERASDEDLQNLRAIVTTLGGVYRSGGVPSMIEVKDRFYEIIYGGTRNPVLWAQAKQLNQRLARLRSRSLSREGRPQQSIIEVEEVFELIAQRDADAAEQAWRAHIRHAAHAALAEPRPATNWAS
jgi:DNA-binding GntR family transcriptional regulator